MLDDQSFQRLLWFLIAGSRGGKTRARIIQNIRAKPLNANQLSEALQLNYKTVQHHLRILVQNRILINQPPGAVYGATYFLTVEMEQSMALFGKICGEFGKK